jgi:hypothetical protein
MNILKIIAELQEERECLDQVLIGLEKLSLKRPRRGRPPKWSQLRATGFAAPQSVAVNGNGSSVNIPFQRAAAAKSAS